MAAQRWAQHVLADVSASCAPDTQSRMGGSEEGGHVPHAFRDAPGRACVLGESTSMTKWDPERMQLERRLADLASENVRLERVERMLRSEMKDLESSLKNYAARFEEIRVAAEDLAIITNKVFRSRIEYSVLVPAEAIQEVTRQFETWLKEST